MEFTINIQAPELSNAINNLAAAIQGNPSTVVISNSIPEGVNIQDAAAKTETPLTLSQEQEPEQSQDEPTTEAPKEKTDVPTIEQLRAKAQQIGKASDNGKASVKALLDQFGCKALSAVPEESRAAFLVELEKLEA